ncbi:MAG: efflux RND transporter periplasmic adaptor subunit, partial [Syntrophothermus sp.]
MKRKHIIILVVVIIAAAVGAWLIFGKKKETAISFKTATIEKGDVKITVTATGTLNADTTVQVGTQVSGIISKIFVDFNSVVRKGQVVALLDTTYLAAAVEDAASALYRNQVQMNLTKRNFDRNKELFQQKVIAQQEYDQSLSDYETAQANVRS